MSPDAEVAVDDGGLGEAVRKDDAPVGSPAPRRQKSTVQFPYNDLASVEDLAAVLHNQRGGRCDVPQLAASLKQAPTSGAFRLKLSAASMYGLIRSESGTITIEPLGRRIVVPDQQAAARVEAFLNVELYARMYEEFRLSTLPNDEGIEAAMARFGVTPSQTARARQVFLRAAEQAGFFELGRSRLVRPTVSGSADVENPQTDRTDHAAEQHVPLTAEALTDPMVVGLFRRLLPCEGQPFPARDRQRFFRSLAVMFDAIYGEPDDGELDLSAFSKLFQPSGS